MDDNGRWWTSKPDINRVAESYFQNLFTSSNPTNLEEVLDAVDSVVTLDINHTLVQQFTPEEVKMALFSMHPSKLPGPNGIAQQGLWLSGVGFPTENHVEARIWWTVGSLSHGDGTHNYVLDAHQWRIKGVHHSITWDKTRRSPFSIFIPFVCRRPLFFNQEDRGEEAVAWHPILYQWSVYIPSIICKW